MGVENYYLANCRREWVDKFVWYEGNRFRVVDVIQTDGFTNPAMDFDYDLIIEGGTQVKVQEVKEDVDDLTTRRQALASKWLTLLRDRNSGPEIEAVEEEIKKELKKRRKKSTRG